MYDIVQRQRCSATDWFWSWFMMVLLVIPMVIIDDIIFGIFSSSPKVLNFQGRIQSFGIFGNFQFLSGTFTQENVFSSMGPFLVIFMRIVCFGSIVTINDKPPKSCKFHKKWQFHQANQNMMAKKLREFTCRAFGRCLL